MFITYNPSQPCYASNDTTKIERKPHAPLVKYSDTEKNNAGFPKAIGITWNCDEPIYLEFMFTGDVVYDDGSKESIVDYIRNSKPLDIGNETAKGFAKFCSTNNKVFQIFIYNENYNTTNWCEIPVNKIEYINNNCCKFRININDFYPKVIARGNYVLELDLVDKSIDFKEVLVNKETCKLFIE